MTSSTIWIFILVLYRQGLCGFLALGFALEKKSYMEKSVVSNSDQREYMLKLINEFYS